MSVVKLARGTGSKAKYNGNLATVRNHRGGWSLASLRQGSPIKWRNGHWEEAEEDKSPTIPNDEEAEEDKSPTLPNDMLGQILGRCLVWDRMRALLVSSAWAQTVDDPVAWSDLITPLDASAWTCSRMIMMIERAGTRGMRVLDLGCEAGRMVGSDSNAMVRMDVDAMDFDAMHPLATKCLELAACGRFSNLQTLRLRYPLPWVTTDLLASLVAQCPVLQHLQLALPQEGLAAIALLPMLCSPSMKILHIKFPNRAHWRADADCLFPSAVLPVARCPLLHTLALSDFVHPWLRAPWSLVPSRWIPRFAQDSEALDTRGRALQL